MSVRLEDALRLFHITRKELGDPVAGRNPLLLEINEALSSGISEEKVANFIVSQYRDAKYRLMDLLTDAARHEKAANPPGSAAENLAVRPADTLQ